MNNYSMAVIYNEVTAEYAGRVVHYKGRTLSLEAWAELLGVKEITMYLRY